LVVHAGALAPPFAWRPGEPPARTVELATAALKVNPEDVEAYHHQAHAHEALGDFARAEADFTQALKLQPANAHFLACRGRDRLRLLDYQGAVADLERALAGNLPTQEGAAAGARLAWTRLAGPAGVRDAAGALPVAQRAAGLVPQNADYRAALALAHHRLGQHPEARLQAEVVKKGKAEADALAWCVLALVAAQQGDAKEARAALERARAWEQVRGKTLAVLRKAALAALRKEAEEALTALAPDS
jgi:tetratricopeptide (TPR) repeat protein